MVIRGILLLHYAMIVALSVSAGADPTTQPAVTLDSSLQQLDVVQNQAEIDRLFPRLRQDATEWGTDFQARFDLQHPGLKSSENLLAVVIESKAPTLARYLNFWNRAGIAPRIQGRYPANTFDQVTSAIPENSAYAIFQEDDARVVYRFVRQKSGDKWHNRSRAHFIGAVRLGAALALIQDTMESIRAGKDIYPFTTDRRIGFAFGKPALWQVAEQRFRGESIGLYPLQNQLKTLELQGISIGLWLHEDDSDKRAVQVDIVTIPTTGYAGWRISNFRKTEEPVTR